VVAVSGTVLHVNGLTGREFEVFDRAYHAHTTYFAGDRLIGWAWIADNVEGPLRYDDDVAEMWEMVRAKEQARIELREKLLSMRRDGGVPGDPFGELKEHSYRLALDMDPGAAQRHPREIEQVARHAMQTISAALEVPPHEG
jgi:hypothetical protein